MAVNVMYFTAHFIPETVIKKVLIGEISEYIVHKEILILNYWSYGPYRNNILTLCRFYFVKRAGIPCEFDQIN